MFEGEREKTKYKITCRIISMHGGFTLWPGHVLVKKFAKINSIKKKRLISFHAGRL